MSSDTKNNASNRDGKRSGKPPQPTRQPDTSPPKPGLAARAAASKILGAVLDRKTSLDGMLDVEGGSAAYTTLSDGDRALVRAILNSALRHLPRIEAAISSLLDSPLPEGARALHHVLVVGATQGVQLFHRAHVQARDEAVIAGDLVAATTRNCSKPISSWSAVTSMPH